MGNKYYYFICILFLLPVECFAYIDGSFAITENHPKYDQILKKNSEAPIRYGESIGFIDWETSWHQAHRILTKPVYNSNVFTAYNEGLSIYWGEGDTPLILTAKREYLGPIEIENPVGLITQPVHMGESFQRYTRDDFDLGIQNLALDLYSALTGDGTHCLKEGMCRVHWVDGVTQHFFIVYPGMSFMINKKDLTLDSIHMLTKKFQSKNSNLVTY